MHIFGFVEEQFGRKSETQTMFPTFANKQQFFSLLDMLVFERSLSINICESFFLI